MSSSVFFKFKSQKEPSRVTFDGTGISVFELKREIITINRLGDGTDFELAIYNEDTNEEYDDDTTIIPRSTSIIARRLPPAKAGRGGAARYVSGKMPANARNSTRTEAPISKPVTQGKRPSTNNGLFDMNGTQTEEEKIEAMFKAGADQWAQQQQEMANATPVHRGGPLKGKPVNVPVHKPPPGYICYRCGEKGHWIQVCPTNNDPNFDGRPRVKRTTGIPRSFLKTIEKPAALTNDGTIDDTKQPSGVMVNAEGEFVIAEPDKASWEQYQAKAKVSAAAQQAAVTGSEDLRERGLECSIDKRRFVEPTRTPCCGKTYCNDCIINALIENDLVCPGCSTEGVLIDNLIPDDETAAKIETYEEEKAGTKIDREKLESSLDKGSVSSTIKSEGAQSTSPSRSNRVSTSTPDPVTNRNPKKRLAEEELSNKRVPDGPGVLRSHNLQGQQQQTVMSSFGPNQLDQWQGLSPDMAFAHQMPLMNNDLMQSHGMNPMAYATDTGYLGMATNMTPMMGMNQGLMQNMMMPSSGGIGSSGNGWNNMGGVGFLQQPNGLYGLGYSNGMMSSGGYAQGNMHFPMGNMAMGMNGMGMSSMPPQQIMATGKSHGAFLNQQSTVFSEPFPNEEDNAYFRKPVNPHRHQARQRRVRPSDYREL
ncbi:MAG: hypothetical protein M1830_010679 [Pleopsidium flavum]|nr:MAG: hypothetical protein M1830_010679 [Pleopsidium flavum]